MSATPEAAVPHVIRHGLAEKTGILFIKADLDLTLLEARHKNNPLLKRLENGPLKYPLAPIPGAREGLQMLASQEDVNFRGLSTARNELLRPWTRTQADLIAPGLEITFTTASFTEKIVDLLDIAKKRELEGNSEAPIARTVLIDDRARRVRNAAQNLAKDPEYAELMDRYQFTLVAFGSQEPEHLESIPGVIDIIPMSDWSEPSVQEVLGKLREIQ